MKTKLYSSIVSVFLLIATFSFAQAPDGLNYQAVVRDGAGDVIASQNILMRFTVRTATKDGAVEYQEDKTLPSNQYGMINHVIGTGNVLQGTFAGISWSSDLKFLQVEMNSLSGFVSLDTTQLVSVPYALSARTADALTGGSTSPWTVSGNDISNNNSGLVGVNSVLQFPSVDAGRRVVLWESAGVGYTGLGKNLQNLTLAIPVTTDFFKFEVGDAQTELMRVTGDGMIGLKTDIPEADLHIQQSASPFPNPTTGGIILQQFSSLNKWQIWNSNTYLSFAYNATRVAYVNNATGDWTVTSDKRFKKDIEPMDDVLANVMKLKTMKYRYNQMTSEQPKSIGFIAQEVQQLFPDLVYTEDGTQLALAKTDFAVLSIKAIQEQQKIIDDLLKQVAELTARVNSMEKK